MSRASDVGPLREARVAVLYGGASEEKEISRESGAGILNALRSAGDPGGLHGPGKVLEIEISESGRWQVGGRSCSMAEALLALSEIDLFFLALHGGAGENGTIQGALESSGVAYTGSGVASSAVCMDKLYARMLVQAHGLRVACGHEVRRGEWQACEDFHLDTLGCGGWVVKPRRGGSSVGVSRLEDQEQLEAALEAAFKIDEALIVEELVRGVEASIGVLDWLGESPVALPPVEITPHDDKFYDYGEKYSEGGARLSCPPESLDHARCERLREMALGAHRALGCAGYSRTDFIVPTSGDPVFLETNTLPGMTSHSLLPHCAAAAGVDYRSLCLHIAADGLARGARG